MLIGVGIRAKANSPPNKRSGSEGSGGGAPAGQFLAFAAVLEQELAGEGCVRHGRVLHLENHVRVLLGLSRLAQAHVHRLQAHQGLG